MDDQEVNLEPLLLKIAQQLEQIRALPVAKQRMVTQMIDAVIAQATR